MADTVRTTCPYCGTGCGVVMSRSRDGWAVGGDPDHPANRGRLCSKGIALPDTLTRRGRLLQPMVDGREVTWDAAIAAIAARLQATLDAHGPDSVAFYVSGQLLTEDYYVVNKLVKGFIGSPHLDTNSRLCMASAVAGHKRAFGGDVVPGCYEDIEAADLVVLAGSNLAWCHPVLAQRLRTARRDRGTRVVVIDPRVTATCDDADLHLPIRPGTDVTLFNGLLRHLHAAGAFDPAFIEAHISGLDVALAAAEDDAPSPATVAEVCGLPRDDLMAFYTLVAETPRTVTVFSQGVNQSAQGTDKVNAILNVHLATGRLGTAGAGPFSVTGQPNAMGGREVGGLANQLAAHMDPDNAADVDRLRRFWRAPTLKGGQGLKAVDMFEAVESGRIKAIWIMATNPAVSLPDAGRVRAALAKCPVVIASDVMADTDTLRFAHIRLPAAAWSEKDGTVTNSERRISRQRAFRPAPGAAKPDWWIVTQVARALGHGRAFRYRRPADVFREHAALSAFENKGRRAFDIGGLAKLSNRAYDALAPVQWPLPTGAKRGTARLFAEGGFPTADGRARMVPVVRRAVPGTAEDAPLLLNTGRYRDQWHTMTRTGLAPRLAAHRPEPLLDIHPEDAAVCGVTDGGLARVSSPSGTVLVRVAVTEGQRRGEVFLPIHWTDTHAAKAVVSRVIPAVTDPVSGQPQSKNVAVQVSPVTPAWQGVLLSRRAPALDRVTYWAAHAAKGCTAYELAGEDGNIGLPEILFAAPDLQRLDYWDAQRGVSRHAWTDGDRLVACLFVGPERPDVARDWLTGMFAGTALTPADRAVVLAGRAPGATEDKGRLVCSCFAVGLNQIVGALRDGRATTVAEIGAALSAGTGCGSCIPELKEVLDANARVAAA